MRLLPPVGSADPCQRPSGAPGRRTVAETHAPGRAARESAAAEVITFLAVDTGTEPMTSPNQALSATTAAQKRQLRTKAPAAAVEYIDARFYEPRLERQGAAQARLVRGGVLARAVRHGQMRDDVVESSSVRRRLWPSSRDRKRELAQAARRLGSKVEHVGESPHTPERDLENRQPSAQLAEFGEHGVGQTASSGRNGYNAVTCAGIPRAADAS